MARQDEDSLPEEDELLDRCLEFMNLITHSGLQREKDNLFEFIAQACLLRAEEEIVEYGYTDYPLLQDVMPYMRLRRMRTVFSGEQQIYVNKVLLVLKKKGAVSMGGPKFA